MKEKLKKYLQDNGIRKKWFAEQIGMDPANFSMILNNKNRNYARKYWKKIIKTSRGHITLQDLAGLEEDQQEDIENKNNK